MAKFKKVQQEATIVEESEMSVNQKRKADDKRTKAEEEAKAIKDAEEKKRLEREKREAEERARKQMCIITAERKVFAHERLRINDRAKYNSINIANRPVNACSVDRTLIKTGMVSEAWRE